MQMRTAGDYPQRMGKVTGFGGAPTEYLELIRTDLGLCMPLQTLSFIQNHYRMAEKREPDVGELIMLDILMWNASQRAMKTRSYELMELSTDSDNIRETFEDMMQKLSALAIKRKGPVELGELLGISGAYMSNIFPERNSNGLSVSCAYDKDGLIRAKAEGSSQAMAYRAGDMDIVLSDTPGKVNIKEGVYIQIEKNEALAGFIDALRDENIRFSARIIKNDLIETIVSESESAEILVPSSLPELAAFGEGDLLILCPAELEQNIVYIGNSRSLRMRRAGRKYKKGGIVFKNPIFGSTLQASFIKKLTETVPKEAISAAIGAELLEGEAECRFEMIAAKPRNEGFDEEKSYDGGREDVSVISVLSDMTSPYESGIAQAVCAAAGAVALGASVEDIRLKNIIRYPADADASALVANILGLYRAETELCLSSADNELIISADAEKPESRSISVAKKNLRGGFGDGSLWIVSPEEKDGKLCFENIRRIFAYMKDLISGGHAIRACALDTDGFGGSEGERKKTPVGSFLVLTKAELIPSEGILTERVGAVGIDEGAEL